MSDWANHVRVATTGNLSPFPPSGSQTIDGVGLSTENGDRVLVKDQTMASQNGIWVVEKGTWTRSADTIAPELTVRVSDGTVNAHTEWVLVSKAPIQVEMTALNFVAQFPWVDARNAGAVLDGATNDQLAIAGALQQLPSGGRLYLDRGTSLLNASLPLNQRNVTIKGDGKDRSIFKAGSGIGSSGTMFLSSGDLETLAIEDVTIDGNFVPQVLVSLNGNQFKQAIFRRVRFQRIANGGLIFSAGADVTVEDCEFDGYGSGRGTALQFNLPITRTRVLNNSFRWLFNGLIYAPTKTSESMQDHLVQGNDFEFGWYTCPVLTIGSTIYSGRLNATYTISSLTDNGQDFSAVPCYSYVRAMPARIGTSATGAVFANVLTDNSQNFLTAGILEGEIIEIQGANARGVVVSVQDAHTLFVEQWFDKNTGQTILIGSSSSGFTTVTYDALGIYLLKVGSITNSNHTVNSTAPLGSWWFDLNGNAITPNSGGLLNDHTTQYEVVPKTNYPIQTTAWTRQARIVANTIKRSYADCISAQGDDHIIADNMIQWGQDTGITADASDSSHGHHVIHDNLIYRAGANGIFAEFLAPIVHDNQIQGAGWVHNESVLAFGGTGITIGPATDPHVHNNIIDGLSLPQTQHAILVLNVSGGELFDNKVRGQHGGNDYDLDIGNSGMRLRHHNAKIAYTSHFGRQASVGQILDLHSTASPVGTVSAAPGSRLVDETSGHLWIKQSGTDTSGWMQVDVFTASDISAIPVGLGKPFVVCLNATLTIAAQTVTGLLVITSQNGLGAVFMLYGPRNDALIVSDPLGEWSSTLGTVGKVNVQFNGTDYVLENKKASDTFQLIMLGGLP